LAPGQYTWGPEGSEGVVVADVLVVDVVVEVLEVEVDIVVVVVVVDATVVVVAAVVSASRLSVLTSAGFSDGATVVTKVRSSMGC